MAIVLQGLIGPIASSCSLNGEQTCAPRRNKIIQDLTQRVRAFLDIDAVESRGQILIGADDSLLLAPVVKESLFERGLRMAMAEKTRSEANRDDIIVIDTSTKVPRKQHRKGADAIDGMLQHMYFSDLGDNTALFGKSSDEQHRQTRDRVNRVPTMEFDYGADVW